jgi:hypothetical protein
VLLLVLQPAAAAAALLVLHAGQGKYLSRLCQLAPAAHHQVLESPVILAHSRHRFASAAAGL